MDDLELMDLFPQFVSNAPEPRPSDTAARIEHSLQDRERLHEIAALRLTEPDVRHILRDICREASSALGLPIGLVTIVLDEAQHFAAQHGLSGWLAEAGGTPVEWSFCQHTVAGKTSFVVNDTQADALVKDSPLVTQDGVRCYAGMPLITSRGHAVGALCVAGVEAREFTASDLATLQRYTAEATRRIETRRVEPRA
jgi:GAF domain-containing protein